MSAGPLDGLLDGLLAGAAWLRPAVAAAVAAMTWPVLVFLLLLMTSYLVLTVLASLDVARALRRGSYAGTEDASASPMTPSVSVVMPAFDEEVGVVESVGAMLALRHPSHEVVLVDDGSTDATFALLQRAFDLVEVPRRLPGDVPVRGAVRSVHVPRGGRVPLVVVRKDNGGRADAVNAGIDAAAHDLVCITDADSVLDPDALLTVSRPFVDDPVRVVATGGAIRAVNGSRLVGGRVVDVRMPRTWAARIQVVEYLRSFVIGRTGWSRTRSLVIVSGAFGMYRRDVLVQVGGLDAGCIGEDMELTLRVHRVMREQGRDHRVVFVPEPAAWTEVPSTYRVLARQRRRWHRGLLEVLWRHRRMLLNPRYGRIGLVAVPYYLVFELLAPVVELAGVVLVPLALALGVVDWRPTLLLAVLATAYGVLVTAAALTVEELSFHRSSRWRDLALASVAMVLECLGHRQLTAWWRVQGLWAALRGRRQEWGVMTREGFAHAPAAERAAVAS